MKNPIFFWIIVVFGIVNIIDAITANFVLVGEANPIYILVGSLTPLYFIKFAMVGGMFLIYRYNSYSTHFIYFLLIMIALFGTFVVGLGATSNIIGIKQLQDPEYKSQILKVSSKEKVRQYVIIVSFIYLLPITISLLGFKVYEWSKHKVKFKFEQKCPIQQPQQLK